VVGDVADPAQVRAAFAGIEACFHLAALASVQRSNEDWLGTHRVNLGGTIAVLDAARAAGRVPVVYASSAAVYGDPVSVPIGEDAACVPLTAYGADKLGSEQHAHVAGRVHGVPTLGLRFFNVYGARQDPSSPYSGVISLFAARAATGQPLCVHGDGRQTRDFVHVSDVVRHLLAARERVAPDAPVLNVCTGRATSIADLARLVLTVAGSASEVRQGPPRAGDIAHSVGDPTRATARLGVAATMGLADGLRLTLDPARAGSSASAA
jgi:UDP-glucose 4-epimerase